MKIETKFKIDDEVWTISNSSITSFKIKGVKIYVLSDNNVVIKYLDTWERSAYIDYNHEFCEDKCFASKEELCQFILKS